MEQKINIDKDRHDKMFGQQKPISLDGTKNKTALPIIDLEAVSKSINETTVTRPSSKEIEIEPIMTYVYLKEDINDGFIASEAGIILGRAEESDYKIGTAISVGQDVTQVTPGVKFMYHKAAVQYLECYGKKFPLIMEKNIICKIK
jgi:hypothetical protein